MVINENWGEPIQVAYEHYLNYGSHKQGWDGWKHYPPKFYNQLEQDGFIAHDLWRSQMSEAKLYVMKGLQYQLALAGMQFNDDVLKKQMKMREISIEIDKVRQGDKEVEIEMLAKRWLVLQAFKLAKHLGYKEIYRNELQNQ